MAVVVRETIKNNDGFFSSPEYEVVFVTVRSFKVIADKAAAGL